MYQHYEHQEYQKYQAPGNDAFWRMRDAFAARPRATRRHLDGICGCDDGGSRSEVIGAVSAHREQAITRVGAQEL